MLSEMTDAMTKYFEPDAEGSKKSQGIKAIISPILDKIIISNSPSLTTLPVENRAISITPLLATLLALRHTKLATKMGLLDSYLVTSR